MINNILVFLDALPNCVAAKRWGTAAALTGGEPDITALSRGRHFELSVSDAADRLTARERERIEEWKQAGAIVAIVSSVGDMRRVLEDYGIF